MKRLVLAAVCISAAWWSRAAHAFPETGAPFHGDFDVIGFTPDYDFEGIVGLSNCSGSLVRFDDSAGADQAMVLTNGHCVRMLSPGTVIVNQRASRRFSLLDADGRELGSVTAVSLLYATMTDTDMAIYKLRETYDEIQSQYRVRPLTLARDYAEVGDSIEVISGYWERGYSCAVEAFVYNLREGEWTFKDSLRYSRPGCEVIGGTSGSPVVLADSRTVVAVNNTANESGRRCTVNNPCEVDAEGNITYQRGYGYAQQTSWLYTCRAGDGSLDLVREGCRLPGP